MSLKDQTLAVIDALNRRDFDRLIAAFEEDAVLDLPDGIRVIGHASFRDTLSAYVLRHDVSLADMLVMIDDAEMRVAVECTLKGSDHRGVDAENGNDAGPYSLPAVVVLARESDVFNRLSLFAAIRP
ncbi:nuclear transport factor 2 family protein [Rhizobium sp. 18065]|uniref:nuclear transport factor 2 family protein n=1 Tax=Rhizobium sp. 18065 TaxID=2681411 RepID=UPI00135CD72F|nr:nuclear transport factor 2 family protein [Rhizobium sp. 18065]